MNFKRGRGTPPPGDIAANGPGQTAQRDLYPARQSAPPPSRACFSGPLHTYHRGKRELPARTGALHRSQPGPGPDGAQRPGMALEQLSGHSRPGHASGLADDRLDTGGLRRPKSGCNARLSGLCVRGEESTFALGGTDQSDLSGRCGVC